MCMLIRMLHHEHCKMYFGDILYSAVELFDEFDSGLGPEDL